MCCYRTRTWRWAVVNRGDVRRSRFVDRVDFWDVSRLCSPSSSGWLVGKTQLNSVVATWIKESHRKRCNDQLFILTQRRSTLTHTHTRIYMIYWITPASAITRSFWIATITPLFTCKSLIPGDLPFNSTLI